MAISAVLQIGESGGNFLQKALASSYTVLDFDYTIERDCDKTGRPSGSASISCITVTIRAASEKNTPFHKWIKEPDFKMDGKITIYDATGKIPSTVRDAISNSSFFNSNDSEDTPDDMKGGADDDDNHDPDIFDEMSHEDLMDYAEKNGIKTDSSDTDDDIRKKIRESKKAQSSESSSESFKDKAVNAAKDPIMSAEQKLLECARNIAFTDAYCISLREHFNNDPDFEGKLDTDYPWTLEIGIKPKKVTFSGSQVFTKSMGSETEFELY